ncbi:hypothetical protein ACQEU3_19275 [Spirillospora sp. CA-253888]
MPRALGVLAAVTGLTALTAALSVPAEAASSSLTLTALGRDGRSVTLDARLYSLVDGSTAKIRTGRAKTLRTGRYAVLAGIESGGTTTLAGTVVKVTGRSRLTFDARKGKPLGLSLDVDPARWSQTDYAGVCIRHGGSSDRLSVWNDAGKVYAIPSAAKELRSAYFGAWSGMGVDPSPDKVYVTGTAQGIPARLGRAHRLADLAKVDVQVRRGPAMSRDTDVNMESASARECGLYGVSERFDAPGTLRAHVTPGSWSARVGTWTPTADSWRNSDWNGPWRTYAARQSFTEVFNRAVWGPRRNLPKVYSGKLSYYPDDLISDHTKSGGECCTMATVTLRRSGKVVKTQKLSQWGSMKFFETKLPATGWYTLDVDAIRHHPKFKAPAGVLSPRATVGWRFYAKKGRSLHAPSVLTKFSAWGLDKNNTAPAGSTTTAGMWMDTAKGMPKLRKVAVQASFDEGRTWKAVTVRKKGTAWEVVVPNAARAGYVALRTSVEDVQGGRSVQTIYRAYGLR